MILKPKWLTKIEAGHRMSKGLVGSWLFNEGGGDLAYDTSGNGYHGTLVEATNFVAGMDGPALEFDGDDSKVMLPVTLEIAGDFSISAWVSTSYAYWQGIFVASGNWYMYLSNDGSLRLFTGTLLNAIGNVPLDNAWTHCLVVRKGTTGFLYIDGVFDSSGPVGSNNFSGVIPEIGGSYNITEHFIGRIGQVLLYNRALNSSEATSLYDNSYQMFKRGG